MVILIFYYKKIQVRQHNRRNPATGKQIIVHSYNRNQRYRNYAEIPRTKARQLFNQRPQRTKTMDLKSTAKKTFNIPNEYWAEHINKSDIKGIDSKKLEWEKDWKKAKKIQEERERAKAKLQSKGLLTKEEYALATLGKDNAKSYEDYLKEEKLKAHYEMGKGLEGEFGIERKRTYENWKNGKFSRA